MMASKKDVKKDWTFKKVWTKIHTFYTLFF